MRLVHDQTQREAPPPHAVRLRSELRVGCRGAGAKLGQQCRLELLVAHLGRNQLDLTPTPMVHDCGLHLGQPEELREAQGEQVLLLRQKPQQQALRVERLVRVRVRVRVRG